MSGARAALPTDFESLWQAWLLVQRKKACAGADGVSVEQFRDGARSRIHALSHKLSAGKYTPYPLKQFVVPKPDGGTRTLTVPTVLDRIVQRAALTALEPFLEASFLSSSYAYRTGRSVKQAVLAVSALRAEGYQWVVHIDVKDCFDSIDWQVLFSRLTAFADPRLRLLIKKWLSAPRIGTAVSYPVKGLPQGGVLSPALCNLVLNDFDLAMHRAGIPEVRYADDCLLFAKSERESRAILLVAADALRQVKLELNTHKSEIVTFDGGFRFLGTLFVKSIVLPCIKIKTDEGKTRYVSGYPGGRRARGRPAKIRVKRSRGHIYVTGNMSRRDLERAVTRAVAAETQGRSSALGRALMEAWKKELSRVSDAFPVGARPCGAVALLE